MLEDRVSDIRKTRAISWAFSPTVTLPAVCSMIFNQFDCVRLPGCQLTRPNVELQISRPAKLKFLTLSSKMAISYVPGVRSPSARDVIHIASSRAIPLVSHFISNERQRRNRNVYGFTVSWLVSRPRPSARRNLVRVRRRRNDARKKNEKRIVCPSKFPT